MSEPYTSLPYPCYTPSHNNAWVSLTHTHTHTHTVDAGPGFLIRAPPPQPTSPPPPHVDDHLPLCCVADSSERTTYTRCTRNVLRRKSIYPVHEWHNYHLCANVRVPGPGILSFAHLRVPRVPSTCIICLVLCQSCHQERKPLFEKTGQSAVCARTSVVDFKVNFSLRSRNVL